MFDSEVPDIKELCKACAAPDSPKHSTRCEAGATGGTGTASNIARGVSNTETRNQESSKGGQRGGRWPARTRKQETRAVWEDRSSKAVMERAMQLQQTPPHSPPLELVIYPITPKRSDYRVLFTY